MTSSLKRSENKDKLHDALRRNFEQQFGSLPEEFSSSFGSVDQQDEDTDEEYSDFEGFDNDIDSSNGTSRTHNSIEKADEPVVVKFSESVVSQVASKRDKKLFMSSKSPTIENNETARSSIEGSKEQEEEEVNLKNDLALQRLITESHILHNAGVSGADLSMEPIGKSRLKALDSRLDSIGAKKSKIQTMPMNIRKGVLAKSSHRQETFQRHAKEAGIVLAKSPKVRKQSSIKMRDRGLKIASVGKSTRNGLVISSDEIARYTSSRSSKR